VRDSGSGRVIAVVVVLLLAVAGGVVTLKTYQKFHPRLVGGITTPAATLRADHDYNIPVQYGLASGPGVRIDKIHLPSVKGLDLTMTAVTCKAAIAKASVTEGPNLAASVFAPKLSPKAYFAQIRRRVYGYKIGTPLNPTMCAVLTAHAQKPGVYHLGAFRLDWRAGLFIGSVHDHTNATLTFS
jgi:hypothetical protein